MMHNNTFGGDGSISQPHQHALTRISGDVSQAEPTHSSISATKGNENIIKTSAIAEFPSHHDGSRSKGSIFRRDDFFGGPVTKATIRFPPKHIAGALNEHDQAATHKYLKSLGRIVFARGSWIESHPLAPRHNNSVDNDATTSSEEDQLQCNTQALEDKCCYKTLAFGELECTRGGTSTFETVSGMIFPSSSSSAMNVESSHSISRRISVVAFGGRRISFLSGGGLWTNDSCLNKSDNTNIESDDFVSIPIAKAGSLNSYLEVSDWIHDVRLLNVEVPQSKNQSAFLLAMGMANNNCEIFGFYSSKRDEQEILHPTRLQCITCDVRCITYSLSFHGWDSTSIFSPDAQLPSLAVASGTVFSDIVVWDAVVNPQEDTTDEESLDTLVTRWLAEVTVGANTMINASRIRRKSLHRLKGHLGSIFSVRVSACGQYIASTSDDRTVRLFQLLPMNESMEWKLTWTGWGHTARVFDVSFAYPPNALGKEWSHPMLVSSGEDSTARIWSPLQAKEVTHPLRGHECESVWTVDVCDGTIITAGNDGCVKLWDLEKRIKEGKDCRTYAVPKDPPIITSSEETIASELTTNKPRKKQNKKPKLSGQLICGMELYERHKLMVATRAGGIFSLDLKLDSWTHHKCWHNNVVSSDDKCKLQIDPTTGTCLSVNPLTAKYAIVGTTEGWLVVTSLNSSSDSDHYSTAFRCPSYRPIQSISWIDDGNIVALYARGSVVWFKMEEKPVPMHRMKLGTPGIPLSYAYDYNQSFYIGDSRGNLVYFDLGQPSRDEILPVSVLKAHSKEHVTAVTVMKSGIIVSVGNDGCMHQGKVAQNGQLQTLVSIPVPATTGLKHIWNVTQSNGQENVVSGGFYGNDYVVMDNINGYEFLRIPTGGRQKRQALHIGFSNGFSHALAICTGQKDGSNIITFHSSHSLDETSTFSVPRHQKINTTYNIGHSYHAETINDIAWVKCGEKPAYLLTGSNDCSVKLLDCRNGIVGSTKELPPHESCVRGVCTSSHPTTNTSLLVTCGGKLTMEFYLLDHSSADIDASVTALCSYRTTGSKATIDHRMNTVRSVPLPSARACHFVVSGDSEGNLHVVLVSEAPNDRKTTIGTILIGNGRPVLCLELVLFNGFVLAFIGNTGGDIQLWTYSISRLIRCCEAEDGLRRLGDVLPSAASCEFKAHQSGVNDLSASIVGGGNESIVVCSVGDDQTISTCIFHFAESGESLLCKDIRFCSTQCTSASALKAVKLVIDDSTFHRVYTSGHDETLTLWKLDLANLSLKYVTSAPIGTEGSCLDCCKYHRPDGSTKEVLAIGGIGMELMSLNLSTLLAACVLREANFLFITAGAGFSADSGLSTYEQAPLSYKEMCDPRRLEEDSLKFQQFWLAFSRSYLTTKPHLGYTILDHWCKGGKLSKLTRLPGNTTPWWVYTSNVDSHFRNTRLASFRESVCEIHGCALEFKCACGIGFANGEPRLGWHEWNDKVQPTDACRDTKLHMRSDDNIPSSLLLCRHCQLPMRPNVLMFHDTDENILRGISLERDRYQAWEASVEKDIEMNGKRFVVLELGCGPTVPAVREESEEVVLDCAKIVQSNKSKGLRSGSVSFIRINPKDAEINISTTNATQMISIFSKAESALKEIDLWIELLQ